jgi:hypothetical protein
MRRGRCIVKGLSNFVLLASISTRNKSVNTIGVLAIRLRLRQIE